MLERLHGGGSFESLATFSDDIRGRRDPVGASLPGELVVFGSDGSDGLFGLWLPKGRSPDAQVPILEIGEGGEGFALAGTDIVSFLMARTAQYLLVLEADTGALDALAFPLELRARWEQMEAQLRAGADSGDPELLQADTRFAADVVAWADPDLPDYSPDPYQRTSVERLRREYGANA